jgi:hypothetical protein
LNVIGLFFPLFFPFARLFVFNVPASILRIHTEGPGTHRILDRLVDWKLWRGQCVLEFWALVTNVRRIFLVALAFVVAHHFLQAIAAWRAEGYERPGACEASPSFHFRRLCPNHLSRYERPKCGALPSQLRISVYDGNQLVLLDAICNLVLRRNRLPAARLAKRSPDNRFLLPNFLGQPVGMRRAFSATETGTCSNRVFFADMLASLIAASTVAALIGYGENL